MDLLQRTDLLIKASVVPGIAQIEKERCRRDIVYFVNTYGYTYDPRVGGELLFNLYPFQEEAIREIVAHIEKGEDLGIEKSRDMGASWIVIYVFVWYWLFVPGSSFHLGSRKEDYVDKLGDVSSLLEKARLILRKLPTWLLPDKYDEKKHALELRLVNPVNGNTITGESSNHNFARAGRYKAVLLDEFAFWPFAPAAWAAASDSTPCRIPTSTPNGKNNQHGKLMTSKVEGEAVANKIRLHWSQHPKKTQEWYNAEKKRRTEDVIARELDINYSGSVQGVIFPEFKPHIHVIETDYEFEPEWTTTVAFDFGTTCAFLLCQIDPYDTLHVFREFILSKTGNTELMGEEYKRIIAKYPTPAKPIRKTCDPAGNTRSFKTKAMETDIDILASIGITGIVYDKIQRMANRLTGGIQMMKSLFIKRNAQGRERILIYGQGCPTLVQALESEYRYKTDPNDQVTDVIDEQHPWEDVVDILRYTVIQFLGVVQEEKPMEGQPPEMQFEV